MNAYEVTIAIPVYNAEKYLRSTLDSALAQSFESIEFLILDDCSTDSSMDIVNEYQQNHPRGKDLRIVRQQNNKGIGSTRNRILDEAQGKFLYFLDSDDTIVPDTINLMWQKAQTCHAQIVLASYARIQTFHEHLVTENYQLPSKEFYEEDDFAEYAFHQYGALQANVWNILMDLDFIRKCGLRFFETNYWEDMVFKYELVTYVSRAVLLPDITYHYMCHEDSLSNFQSRKEISKSEVLRNAATIGVLKQNYERLMGKPYFPNWLNFVLQTDFYIICNVLKRGNSIHPSISNRELQGFLASPLTIKETWNYGNFQTLFFKCLSVLPPVMMVMVIKILGKFKRLF